jgi:hypothetical protein
MNTRSSKEYRYIFTTTWKQASTSHLFSRLTTRAASSWLSLSYLNFSCCQVPFCEFPNTQPHFTTGMTCNVLHFCSFCKPTFSVLPASGTHCTIQTQTQYYASYVSYLPHGRKSSKYLLIYSVVLVGKRTIPTDRPPLVGEVSANSCG